MNISAPTLEQYLKAKEIVHYYEKEQNRLHQIKVEAFREDLKKYFSENLIDGIYKLEEFDLRDNNIIPKNPCLEESYEGGNNADIEKLCEKHGVKFSIIYWCYHK
jgi:hypothetical protein